MIHVTQGHIKTGTNDHKQHETEEDNTNLQNSAIVSVTADSAADQQIEVGKTSDNQIRAPTTDRSATSDNQISAPTTDHSPTRDNQISAPTTDHSPICDNQISAPTTDRSATSDNQISAPTTDRSATSDNQISAPTTDHSPTCDNQISAPTTDHSANRDNQISVSTNDCSATCDNKISSPTTDRSATCDNQISSPTTDRSATGDNQISAPKTDRSATCDNQISAHTTDRNATSDNQISAPTTDRSATCDNQISAHTTDHRLTHEHTFLVPLRRHKTLASPTASLIKGDCVLYSPSDDSPDTSPEIIETPFYNNTFSFTFDDDPPCSSSPERCVDRHPEWIPTEAESTQRVVNPEISTAIVDDNGCVDSEATSVKVADRSDENNQSISTECQPEHTDSEVRLKDTGEQRLVVNPKLSLRNRVRLDLVTKMKISDKPVRCLILTRYDCCSDEVVFVFQNHTDSKLLL